MTAPLPRVGDRVIVADRAGAGLYCHACREEIPPGMSGTITAAGVDAQFGHVGVLLDGHGHSVPATIASTRTGKALDPAVRRIASDPTQVVVDGTVVATTRRIDLT